MSKVVISSLHAMEDDERIKQIFIEPVIENGLGIAIMDRIYKAVLIQEHLLNLFPTRVFVCLESGRV